MFKRLSSRRRSSRSKKSSDAHDSEEGEPLGSTAMMSTASQPGTPRPHEALPAASASAPPTHRDHHHRRGVEDALHSVEDALHGVEEALEHRVDAVEDAVAHRVHDVEDALAHGADALRDALATAHLAPARGAPPSEAAGLLDPLLEPTPEDAEGAPHPGADPIDEAEARALR